MAVVTAIACFPDKGMELEMGRMQGSLLEEMSGISRNTISLSSPLSYFQLALESIGVHGIASWIGLHPNTVSRWRETGRVPSAYVPDFQRMLGKEGDYGDAKDQYFTLPETAEKCYNIFLDTLGKLGIRTTGYTYIEPSMGEGCFYDLLPKQKRIGIDIEPVRPDTIKSDFLKWHPTRKGKYLVVGNPPFGLRGHLALQFINHASRFADAVGFILPQNFGSDGKGAPGKRVKEYQRASNEDLRGEHFQKPDGSKTCINTVFQVWTRVGVENIITPLSKSCSQFIRVFSLSDGGTSASTRNKQWIGQCDVYLPSTTYSGMRAYLSFDELPRQRGYGVVIKQQKQRIRTLLLNHDWTETAFPSTNSAINLRKSLIENVVIDAGFTDNEAR